jgi:hypothetical protein
MELKVHTAGIIVAANDAPAMRRIADTMMYCGVAIYVH